MDQTQPSDVSRQSISIADLPKRPQRGNNYQKIGRPLNIVSNHFKLDMENSNMTVLSFEIVDQANVEIEQDNRKLRESIMFSLKGQMRRDLQAKCFVRGWNILALNLIDKKFTYETSIDGQKYFVKVQPTKKFKLQDILNDDNLNQSFRQMVNFMIKDILKNKLKYVESGKNSKFYRMQDINKNLIQNSQLKVWTGYKTSTSIFGNIPYLLIDYQTRVLRQETALERFYSLKNWSREDINEYFQDYSVLLGYSNGSICKIHKIDFNRTPQSKFTMKNRKTGDQEEVSFAEYYKKRYNLTIKDLKQPMIVHYPYLNKKDATKEQRQQETVLVPELVNMTGMTDEEKADFHLQKDVALFTKKSPQERMKIIEDLGDDLCDHLKNMNSQLGNCNKMEAIQLNQPNLIMKKNLRVDKGFFVLKDPILNPGVFDNWIMIYVSKGNRDDDLADEFVANLQKASKAFGITVKKPMYFVMKDYNLKNWKKEVREDIQDNGDPQMVLTFIGDREKSKYKELKQFFFNELGVNHQNVIVQKYFKSKNKMSHCSKIILQMNEKIGKACWAVEPIQSLPSKMMIIGVDVYHKTIQNKKSCAGFVASLDKDFNKYHSKIVMQRQGQELMKSIAQEVLESLLVYKKENNYLPELIVIYRDGVGDSQITDLLQIEVDQIKALFKTLNNYNPQFLVIQVNKRISDRFFVSSQNKYDNPPSGTLVNSVVVNDYFDFFLVPQYVTQGTATPCRYTVIHNETKLTQDVICQLTYFQCFNYANWTGAVRVPAAVQYAHKLAYLVGETFQNEIHQKLTTKLSFL